jgi:hypothetical protein
MTDTYRIKPLVWQAGRDSAINYGFAVAGHMKVLAFRDGYWRVSARDIETLATGQAEKSVDAAKLAAEAAYRDLLMGALEKVE